MFRCVVNHVADCVFSGGEVEGGAAERKTETTRGPTEGRQYLIIHLLKKHQQTSKLSLQTGDSVQPTV